MNETSQGADKNLQPVRITNARGSMYRFWAVSIVLLGLGNSTSYAETVDVKYRGPVDLKTFSCTDVSRSSFIERVCYDKVQSYMLINLRGTYYHYCELPPDTFDAFMAAPSMGVFYNSNIKEKFDCRLRDTSEYLAVAATSPNKVSWPRLSEQNLRIDKWSLCRVRLPSGVAAG